jgi:WD40 repeat protein
MPSIYQELPLSLRNTADESTLAWSAVDGILAVSRGNSVEFFDEDGQRIVGLHVRRGHNALAMAWHPLTKTIAIGWSDGTLTIYNCSTRAQREDGSIHRSPIRLVKWSPSSTRLLTGDEEGTLGLWTLDLHSRIIPICQHPRKQGSITHCVFFDLAGPPPTSRKKRSSPSHKARAMVTSLFFAVKLRRPANSGTVLFADDMGHCMTVCSTKGFPVVALMQHTTRATTTTTTTAVTTSASPTRTKKKKRGSGGKQVLNVVSADLLLREFVVGEKGAVIPLRESKLGHAGADAYFAAMWAGAGLMLTASNEVFFFYQKTPISHEI